MRSKAAKLATIDENFDGKSAIWLAVKSRSKEGFKPLTTLEDDLMIHHYTTKFGYKPLNEALRNGNKMTKDVKILNSGLKKALKKAPSYNVNQGANRGDYLYRSQGQFSGIEQLKPGDTYKFPQYTSTTYDSNANDLFDSNYRVIMKPRKTNSGGKMIESVSQAKGEKEVLFNPNVKFKIHEIRPVDRAKTQIYMEEM